MYFKVIDDNKVKILVEQSDTADIGITFESLDYNDDITRAFILSLLKNAYIHTGMNFLDSKVFIEAVAGSCGSFYIIVTRVCKEGTPSVNLDKTAKADKDMYLFELFSPEVVYDIVGILNNTDALKADSAKLYKYKGKLYLAIDFSPETTDKDEFYILIKNISEYSYKCKWRILNDALLYEWGELISDNVMNLKS